MYILNIYKIWKYRKKYIYTRYNAIRLQKGQRWGGEEYIFFTSSIQISQGFTLDALLSL